MPTEIGVLKLLDKASFDEGTLRGVGNSKYAWIAYEGDLQLDALNQTVVLEGSDKLAQSIFKIVLTPLGSNPEDPEYGTLIDRGIGDKFDSTKFAEIRQSIIDALLHLNLINEDNPDPDEYIETIDEITTVNDLDEPRAMRIRITVTSESGKQIPIEVPQVI